MQRALLASVILGVVCSLLGVFVVLRGQALLGHGIAHSAFAGVALGLLLGKHVFLITLLFALLTAVGIAYIEDKGTISSDIPIGIFFSSSMALGILFIGFMDTYNNEVYSVLFGNILAVTNEDFLSIVVISFIVIATILLLFKEFEFMTFDREMAIIVGLPVAFLSYLLLVLTALTIVVSIKSIGAVLVFALIVTPAASAYELTHNLRIMTIYSVIIGVFSSIIGLFMSYYYDLPSGATIVLTVTAIFFLCFFISPRRRRPCCKKEKDRV